MPKKLISIILNQMKIDLASYRVISVLIPFTVSSFNVLSKLRPQSRFTCLKKY